MPEINGFERKSIWQIFKKYMFFLVFLVVRSIKKCDFPNPARKKLTRWNKVRHKCLSFQSRKINPQGLGGGGGFSEKVNESL